MHINLVFALVFFEKALKRGALFGGRTVYRRQIPLIYFAVLYLFTKNFECLGVFSRQHYAAGVAVYAVGKRGGKGLRFFGVVFPFFVKVALNPADQGIAKLLAVRVGEKPLRFIGGDNVLVLVNDIKRGARR